MKHKKDLMDDNDNLDELEEFILSDAQSKSQSQDVKPASEPEFEIGEKKEKTQNPEPSEHAKKPDLEVKAVSEESPEAAEKKDGASGEEKVDSNRVKKLDDELAAAKKKVDELSEQVASVNDKYLRLMAEFDNFKRRSAKEYERMIEAANERLMKDITEVRENFERAFKSNADAEKFSEGMKLIFAKLNTILQKHGLEVYAENGQKFDPEIHDALMKMPHHEFDEGHIVEVHERGYKLKGNILKHAKVVVSSGKPESKKTEEETVIEIK
jgi:molecular chaperone GrpE